MASTTEAMAAMCRHMDAENKRLLQSVADKNVIIAAGLQREQAKAKENVALYEEHVEWMNKYTKLQGEYGELLREFRGMQSRHSELQKDYIKDLVALRVVSNENKGLKAELAALTTMDRRPPIRTPKAENDRSKRQRPATVGCNGMQ